MIRTILVLALLANTLAAQDPNSTLNLGQAIGQGAVKSVSDLEARIAVLEQLVPAYIPTDTWPGHDGPEPFEALRKHFSDEKHTRDVAKWTRGTGFHTRLRPHQRTTTANKGLPVLKDQRLRDWVRAKSPAKPSSERL